MTNSEVIHLLEEREAKRSSSDASSQGKRKKRKRAEASASNQIDSSVLQYLKKCPCGAKVGVLIRSATGRLEPTRTILH